MYDADARIKIILEKSKNYCQERNLQNNSKLRNLLKERKQKISRNLLNIHS